MKPGAFEYHRAHSVDEAVSLLTELGGDAKLLAGGQSLVGMMNFRLARPSALIDISLVDALNYITLNGEGLRIGALTSHRAVERLDDPVASERFSVLPRSAHWIGHYAIRSVGTFGGSIAHADPAAEWCMLALLLDAEVAVVGPRGERVVPVRDFFTGFLQTDLAEDEILTEVRFSTAWPHAALHEFSRRHGDFAIVAAAAAVQMSGDHCTDARIVIGGVDSTVIRVADAENVLTGATINADSIGEAAAVAARAVDPPEDLNGSAAYRRHLTEVLVRRALDEAIAHGE
jgi:carbon-monoxide dehydrogenase medium subunit